ncbi:hypothetical protein D3C80_2157190 [compost metagenome]
MVVICSPLVQVDPVEPKGVNGTVKLSGNILLPELVARVLQEQGGCLPVHLKGIAVLIFLRIIFV